MSAHDQVARGKSLKVGTDGYLRDAKLLGKLGDRDPHAIADPFDDLLPSFFQVRAGIERCKCPH